MKDPFGCSIMRKVVGRWRNASFSSVAAFVAIALLILTLKFRKFPSTHHTLLASQLFRLDDGWPESEKDVFQAALSMVVVKDSR